MGNLNNNKKKESSENFLNNSNEKVPQKEFSDYFSLINKKMLRYYEENKNNKFNLNLSLDKKDFNYTPISRRIEVNNNIDFIYWKTYFLNYLSKQNKKGHYWAGELFCIIKSEIFLSESKFLGLFFWEEFEIRAKPKCLKNLNSPLQFDNNENIPSDYSITDKMNSSFCSVNDTNASNDPSNEYREIRNKIKTYISIFKKHIFDPEHPINIIATHFNNVFAKFLEEKNTELYNLKNSEEEDFNKIVIDTTNDLVRIVQKFIIKLQTTLRLFYSRTLDYRCFIEERDEFINLISNLIFKQGKVYEYLYEFFEISLYSDLKTLENNMKQLINIKPEELGIHEKFCLNNTTLEYQKKLLNNKTNLKESVEEDNFFIKDELIKKVEAQIDNFKGKESLYLSPTSNSMYFYIIITLVLNSLKDEALELAKSENSKKDLIVYSSTDLLAKSIRKARRKSNIVIPNDKKYFSAYKPAVSLLRSISKYRVPFSKMLLFASISSEITECVNEFWKDFNDLITPSLLNIDADELMTLFIYIIIKSQMPQLLVHCKFVKEFTTGSTRSTMIGYYYTTVEASLIYIMAIKDRSMLNNRELIRTSLRNSSKLNEDKDFSKRAINTSDMS